MATSKETDISKLNGSDAALSALREQSDRMLAINSRMVSIYGGFMRHWLERRQTAASSAIDIAQRALRANGNDEASNLPALYGEWMRGSFQRIAADLQECQDCGSRIAGMMGEAMPHWPGFSAGEGDVGQERPSPKEPASKE